MKDINDFDVVVCGGGPAGIAAAVAAARGGARTILIEQLFHLGAARINFDPVKQHAPDSISFDPETFKALASRTLLEAGVTVLCGTVVSEVAMDGNTVIRVFGVNKSGKHLFKSKIVVDQYFQCSAGDKGQIDNREKACGVFNVFEYKGNDMKNSFMKGAHSYV